MLIGFMGSIFFSSLAQGLYEAHSPNNNPTDRAIWSTALSSALTRLYTYTRARPPSRTLVDPLDAFISTLQQDRASYQDAVQKAGEAAEATKHLAAKAGRAAYVEAEKFKGIADPGAKGVQVILEALFPRST
jgi:triose/dihydroxyacetone kinase / FAD-AMP lyase (cyclizing)